MELLCRHIDELLTMAPGRDGLGIVEHAAIGFEGGRVAWVGPSAAAPPARREIDCSGCVGLPGLVDCHTHALFAGSRAAEFRQRLAGRSYAEILEEGGGILHTVAASRAAGDDELREALSRRLGFFLAAGVTTVEVKSGYGLDLHHEIRHLRLLAEGPWPVRVLPTFLGAHAVPPEWRGDPGGYAELVATTMVPAAAGIARQVDVYCDRGAFTVEQAERVLAAGIAAGLGGRIHAEQLARTGAAVLAGRLGCLSADHLERVGPEGIRALARAGTVAVLLPGAQLYLGGSPPPVASLRAAGVPMAVATDFNPGSSPVRDLWTCATLACVRMGLGVEEALLGVTRNAAMALGRPDLGWLGPGSAGDLVLVRPPPGEPARHEVLVQYLGGHRAWLVVRDGRVVLGP